ncbi:AlpA family transcriptional regulator [Microbacterium sp. Marseille-Q6965]|uniref:helix-turn-helix transcriptional regulator n=1 Tax=Microbacterium sp. Marseille-Q6965 TaxID=2965072 RepID=UPI0021B7AC37|nr:helix-turn-helix domain-containing protein [Microbacterium sp. Marseille-Q6965]
MSGDTPVTRHVEADFALRMRDRRDAVHVFCMDTMNPQGLEPLLTPRELSDLLHIPVRTLESWRANWESNPYGPKPITVGKHVRYRPVDVRSWLDEQAAR